MPKRGHQPRGLLVTDPGKFLVTVSAIAPVQGATVTVFAQFATSTGSPVAEAGKVITWGKSGAGGSFNSATSATNIHGVASVTLTVGTTIGAVYTVTANGTNNVRGTSPSITVVADLVPVSLALTPAPLTLVVGTTGQLAAVVQNAIGATLPAIAPLAPVYASSNLAVATVSATGLVTAIASGTATISATLAGITSNSVAVTVTASSTPASIVIGPATVTVALGTVQLVAAVKTAAGDIIPGVLPSAWISSNPSVATVSSTGLVTVVAAGGPITITATLGGLTSNTSSVTVSGGGGGGSTDATLPTLLTTTMASTPSLGNVHTVAAGDDLQAVLNAALPGDKIILDHTGTWDGNYVMPAKSGGLTGGWITIYGDGGTPFPPEGTRITPAFVASNRLPKIRSLGGQSGLRTDLFAARWRTIGVEICNHPTLAANNTWGMVAIGDAGDFQTTSAQVAEDILYDRCYIHGDSAFDCRRGVSLNGRRSGIIDSYVSEIHSVFDAQAIAGWNGPGPYKISNTYLEASGENIAFGGADPKVIGTIPSDIEITRNHVAKQLAWKGGPWLIKNLLELKVGKRVLISGNVFENCWPNGQAGYAFVLWSVNQQGTNPTAETSHVTIEKNVIRNTAAWFNLAATGANGDPALSAVPMHHLTIRNNVGIGLDNPTVSQAQGRLFQMSDQINQLTIEHNTGFSQSNSTFIWGGARPLTDHLIRNNILGGGLYQMFNGNQGDVAWQQEAGPGSECRGNVIALMTVAPPAGNSTPGSFDDIGFAGGGSKAGDVTATLADLTLTSGSQYHLTGTDGTDPGADIAAVAAAVSGVGGGF